MIFDLSAGMGGGRKYLYKAGDECEAVTGGWEAIARAIYDGNYAQVPPVTKNATTMVIKNPTSAGGGTVNTVNAIDLTGRKTLVFEGSVTTNETDASCCLGIWSSKSGYYGDSSLVAYKNLQGVSSEATIDVSALSGAYYIGFGVHTNSSTSTTITMNNMYLK